MPLTVVSTQAFRKGSKHFEEEVLREQKQKIRDNPNIGNSLKGNLKGFRTIHFGRKPEYRLLYYFESNCKVIDKQKKEKCKYDVEHSEIELANCTGYVCFSLVDSREAFNNLYKLKRKNLI